MIVDTTRRMRPVILDTDKAAFEALKDIKDYSPANKGSSVDKIQSLYDSMEAGKSKEAKAIAAADAARDQATAAEWAFHNAILSAKDQVKAQYGADSDEVQALGLVKKSEKAKPKRKAKAAPAAAAK